MWATRLISDDGLTVTQDGFALDIRLPWYRTLPVATFRELTLRLDGEEIPRDQIKLAINGKPYGLVETESAPVDVLWHVQDSASLLVKDVRLPERDAHKVDLTLVIAVPYAKNFNLVTQCIKTLRAASGDRT